MAQQVIEQAVATIAQELENKIDKEINKLDNLNDDDLDSIRANRMAEMRKRQDKMKEWLARGHGEYQELLSEKEFFSTMKVGSPRPPHLAPTALL